MFFRAGEGREAGSLDTRTTEVTPCENPYVTLTDKPRSRDPRYRLLARGKELLAKLPQTRRVKS